MEKDVQVEIKVQEVYETYCCCSFSLHAEKDEKLLQSLTAFIVLDKSGSMAGGRMKQAKEALLKYLEFLQSVKCNAIVLAFNNTIECVSTKEKGFEGVKKFVQDVEANGGTVFSIVFEQMAKMCVESKEKNITLLFLSDGEDGERPRRKAPFEDFSKYMRDNNITSSIHCLGIGESHDAAFLTSLVPYGTKQGSFQYIAESSQTDAALDMIIKTMDFCAYSGTLDLGGKKRKLLFSQTEGSLVTAEAYMLKEEFKEIKLELYRNGQITPCKMKIVDERAKELGFEEKANLFLGFANEKIMNLIKEISQPGLPKEEIIKLKEEAEKLDITLTAIYNECFGKREEKEKRMAIINEVVEKKGLIGKFHEATASSIAKQLSNTQIAQLNNLAYKGTLTKALSKEMSKRALIGQEFMEKMNKEISEIRKAQNIKEIGEKYKAQIDEYGTCPITTLNWLEALEEGDCLCLTFNSQGSQMTISDATKIEIKAINSTMVTADAFISSALYAAQRGHEFQKLEYVVGKQKATSLVKAVPGEIITGILPLYINEDHWKISRLKARPLLAFTATLDILGITEHQPIKIPFVLLSKAAEDLTSEFKKKQFQWILEVCLAFYKETKELVWKKTLEPFQAYLHSPEARVYEKIVSNPVMLGYLLCGKHFNDVDVSVLPKMMPLVVEEDIRRVLKRRLGATITKELLRDIIGVGSMGSAKEEAKKVGNIKELSHKAKEIVASINALFQTPGTEMYGTLAMMRLFGLKSYESLDSMGIDTNEKKVGLIYLSLWFKTSDVSVFDQISAQKLIIEAFDKAENVYNPPTISKLCKSQKADPKAIASKKVVVGRSYAKLAEEFMGADLAKAKEIAEAITRRKGKNKLIRYIKDPSPEQKEILRNAGYKI